MACNATIARLCTLLVAICAGSTGATLDAGVRALAAGRPVLAVGATAGSRLLVAYGATAAVDEIELTWWLGRQLGQVPAVQECLAAANGHARGAASACAEPRPPSGGRADGGTAWHRPARRWSTA
jgi:hypothetical protein